MSLCTYCGDPGFTKDHLAPKGWRQMTSRTVPCCALCNAILRDALVFTIPGRAAVLFDRIIERKKHLRRYGFNRLHKIRITAQLPAYTDSAIRMALRSVETTSRPYRPT